MEKWIEQLLKDNERLRSEKEMLHAQVENLKHNISCSKEGISKAVTSLPFELADAIRGQALETQEIIDRRLLNDCVEPDPITSCTAVLPTPVRLQYFNKFLEVNTIDVHAFDEFVQCAPTTFHRHVDPSQYYTADELQGLSKSVRSLYRKIQLVLREELRFEPRFQRD